MQGIDLALSQKKIQGLCLLCFENERPPQGALGYLDWITAGHFTKLLKSQVLTGKKNQILYTPLIFNEHPLHFLLVGGGYLETPGRRPKFDSELFAEALKQTRGLNLENIGLVPSDWNITGEEEALFPPTQRNLCVLS